MKQFNYKQWLVENKVGPYDKILNEDSHQKLEGWDPDKDWDEEEDEEEPYENDMDNLDTTLPKEGSIGEYYEKDALQSQALGLDNDISWSSSADWDDSSFESDQKEYLKKLAWVLKQKGASDREIKNTLRNSFLLSKGRNYKRYYELYQDVKNWGKKNIKGATAK